MWWAYMFSYEDVRPLSAFFRGTEANARNETRTRLETRKKNAFRFRAPHLAHVSPRVFLPSTVKRKKI